MDVIFSVISFKSDLTSRWLEPEGIGLELSSEFDKSNSKETWCIDLFD